MRILVSGATATMRRLAAAGPFARAHLGHLAVPLAGNSFEALSATGLPIACDNGCFSGWDARKFHAMVRAAAEAGVPLEWVCVQDHYDRKAGRGYARSTLELFYHVAELVEPGDPADATVPLALVAQDGVEDLDIDWFLGMAECLFLGGSTEWKLSQAAADLATAAKRRGKLVHMGRVNTRQRIAHALSIGCDSIDGTGFSNWPDINIAKGLRWLAELEAPTLFSLSGDDDGKPDQTEPATGVVGIHLAAGQRALPHRRPDDSPAAAPAERYHPASPGRVGGGEMAWPVAPRADDR